MRKLKLLAVRKQKGYTQQQIADIIATDVSNFSRKESGDTKIFKYEWEKIARFLDVPLDLIYEEDIVVIDPELVNDQAIKRYILKLENENTKLKKEIQIINRRMVFAIKILSK